MKSFARLLVVSSIAWQLSACTSSPKTDSPVTQPTPPSQRKLPPLDLNKLSQNLSFDLSPEEVGFHEKTFNDCELPQPYRLNAGCSTQYITSLQFRMRCRQSEGTVENVSHIELEPLHGNGIQWNLGSFSGTTSTNSSGYGKILAISRASLRHAKFRLTHNGQIMGVSASEVRQFVLPSYWCQ